VQIWHPMGLRHPVFSLENASYLGVRQLAPKVYHFEKKSVARSFIVHVCWEI